MKRNPIEPFKIVKIRKIKQGKNISTPIKKEKEKDESIEDKRRNNKEKDNKILKKFSEKDKSETNNTIKYKISKIKVNIFLILEFFRKIESIQRKNF